MRQAILITVSVAALALASCGPKTDTANTTTVTTENMSVADDMAVNDTAAPVASAGQTFANTAAASDAFEIATSKLAATNAKSPAIKSFATKMITAHTDSTAKLKTASAAASPALTPDPTMTAEQQAKLAELQGKTGADFDTAYAAAQAEGHQKTLDALKAYAASGDVPELKSFANTLVPIVTGHLNMAKGLKA